MDGLWGHEPFLLLSHVSFRVSNPKERDTPLSSFHGPRRYVWQTTKKGHKYRNPCPFINHQKGDRSRPYHQNLENFGNPIPFRRTTRRTRRAPRRRCRRDPPPRSPPWRLPPPPAGPGLRRAAAEASVCHWAMGQHPNRTPSELGSKIPTKMGGVKIP